MPYGVQQQNEMQYNNNTFFQRIGGVPGALKGGGGSGDYDPRIASNPSNFSDSPRNPSNTPTYLKADWGLPHKGIVTPPLELPDNNREDNGPVSRLQEWIQAQSKQGNYQRILHWFFDQQMEDRITLQFKATVSFVLDNVPHHVEGEWQTSKKKSQRDTAERALFHFANLENVLVPSIHEGSLPALAKIDPYIKYAMEEDQENGYRATAQFFVSGSPHHFRGSWQPSKQEAKVDCANRTVAYLRVPEYRQMFDIPAGILGPPETFDMKAQADDYPSRVAQQKTALMQVQNLLQKVYSKEIVPGEDMWEWEWQSDPMTGKTHNVTVHVPVTGQRFSGQWCQGKKEAQRTACEELKKFLMEKLKEQEEKEVQKKPGALVGRKQYAAADRAGSWRD